jgi:hypothetical protein
MTHYAERKELFDGDVVIFKRSDADVSLDKRYWQARFKIAGRAGFITKSLKTRKYEDAYQVAKDMYLRFQQMHKEGASLVEKTFGQAWDEWFKYKVTEGGWSDSRKQWHKSYGERYFKPYFAHYKLDSITADVADGYWAWRRNYWISGEGAKRIVKNPKRRGLPNRGTANHAKNPALKSLQMEQAALNQFFKWASQKKRLMRFPVHLTVPPTQKKDNEGRRPAFDKLEWNSLTRNLQSWAEGVGKYKGERLTQQHMHQRAQIRFFVLFIAGTGIRPGTETRFMKWEDISFFKDQDGDEKAQIRIRQHTKKGVQRNVISMPNVVGWLREWRKISRYNGDQDLVWYGQSKKHGKQSPATDPNKSFQAFLKTVEYKDRKDGLLYDGDGRRRSLYSLRHFYATQRVLNGVEYETLRKNMGTGIMQLQKHYDWVETRQKSVELTKRR